MKTATKQAKAPSEVQQNENSKNTNLMVVQKGEGPKKPELNKGEDLPGTTSKREEAKPKAETYTPTAEDRIKRASNFNLLTGKFTHLKMKNEELEKFMISSDGVKETLSLENSIGNKITVNNSHVMAKVTQLLKSTLDELLAETEHEVKTFVI